MKITIFFFFVCVFVIQLFFIYLLCIKQFLLSLVMFFWIFFFFFESEVVVYGKKKVLNYCHKLSIKLISFDVELYQVSPWPCGKGSTSRLEWNGVITDLWIGFSSHKASPKSCKKFLPYAIKVTILIGHYKKRLFIPKIPTDLPFELMCL